jgi:hypothetical protein
MKKFLFLVGLSFFMVGCSQSDWRTASRESAGIALDPEVNQQAVIEVYGADAFSWRGWFAVHTWIALKHENATEYTVYEVVGWRLKRGLPALKQYQTKTPDRYWYGSKPEKILSLSGKKASTLISQVEKAIENYPWANEYTLFPGPNSNTFPAWVGLQVPELELKMPFNAIGSGYAD